MGTRRDLFSDEAIRTLALLRDQVGGRPARHLERLLENHLAGTGHRLTSFDPCPLASGSIALVHLVAVSGMKERLAVKVRRAGVAKTVKQDLRLMRGAARLLGRLRRFTHIPLSEMAETMGAAVWRQLDFLNEIENVARFRREFSGTAVSFPQVHVNLSSEEVIFMTYEHGIVGIDDPHQLDDADNSYECVLSAIYRMLFVTGFFHCDVHPGNVFFRQSGGCLFLDCGLAVALTEAERDMFSDFFLCVALNRGARAADLLLRNALSVPPALDLASFRRDIASVVGRAAGRRARDFKVTAFVSDLFDEMRRHRVVSAPQFVWMITVLLTIEGPVKAHCPDMDFQRIAVDVIVGSRAILAD